MSPAISITPSGRISIATLAGARRSPVGVIGSALLHASIIGATLFTFAHKLDISQESPPVVPIDLVTLAPKTNIIATVKVKPAEPPKEQEPAAPQPQKIEAPPPPEEPKAEKLDVAPAPKPKLKPVEAPPPPPETVAPEPAPKPPPPVPKPKPEPKLQTEDLPKNKAHDQPTKTVEDEPKKQDFDINKVMALLDKREAAQSSPKSARLADKTIKGFGAQNAMTMDLQDSLRSQIQQCWNPPVGAPHPEELVVGFELFLKPDGSVAQPPQLSAESQSAVAHDSFTRAAAEAARRAIYTCAPYKLPQDRYTQWQDITLTFDPRQMLGQ